MKFIDLDSQYDLIKKDLNHRLKKIFIKKDFIQGKEVGKLEDSLSKISKFLYSFILFTILDLIEYNQH